MSAHHTVRYITDCPSLEEAIKHILESVEAKSDISQRVYQMGSYQGFAVHRHHSADEWVVVYNAEFDFVTRGGGADKTTHIQSLGQATVIHIPAGTCHAVRSRGAGLKYAVVKSGLEDFVACRE